MECNVDLHIHPFYNSMDDIIQSMEDSNLDIIALEELDSDSYPSIIDKLTETTKFYSDDYGVRLPGERYIMRGQELSTTEGLHLLMIGYSIDAQKKREIRDLIDTGLEKDALLVLDHPYADNIHTRTAGHITKELEKNVEDICKEYKGDIAIEWNAYCIPGLRKILKKILNFFGHPTYYSDINTKAARLADRFSLPLIADTDLHARNKQLLRSMGTASFVTDLEPAEPKEVLDSMKKKIFSGDYSNIKNYVSKTHLIRAYGLPIMLPGIFEKPRA